MLDVARVNLHNERVSIVRLVKTQIVRHLMLRLRRKLAPLAVNAALFWCGSTREISVRAMNNTTFISWRAVTNDLR